MLDWFTDIINAFYRLRNQEWATIISTLLGLLVVGLLIGFFGSALSCLSIVGIALPVGFSITLGAITVITAITILSTAVGTLFDAILKERTLPGLLKDFTLNIYSNFRNEQKEKLAPLSQNDLSHAKSLMVPTINSEISVPQKKYLSNAHIGIAIGIGIGTILSISSVVIAGIAIAAAGATVPPLLAALGIGIGGPLAVVLVSTPLSSFFKAQGDVVDKLCNNKTVFDWLYDWIAFKNPKSQSSDKELTTVKIAEKIQVQNKSTKVTSQVKQQTSWDKSLRSPTYYKIQENHAGFYKNKQHKSADDVAELMQMRVLEESSRFSLERKS